MIKISIVTVSYNAADTIADAMRSVLRQKREGLEIDYIVVDGGSSDGTVDIIKAFDREVKEAGDGSFAFRWLSEKDDGLYDAMNKGVRIAIGSVVGVLNADDMMAADDVLERVAREFGKDDGLEFACSDVRFVDRTTTLDGLHEAKTRRYICPLFWRPWMLTFGYAPPHPGMYIKRSCFERFGYYKHKYRIGADYEMTVRFCRRHGVRSSYIRKCAVAMRLGGASTEKGNVGSFVGNNYDVVAANRENGYWGNRWLVMLKLPVKCLEILIPKLFPRIGA